MRDVERNLFWATGLREPFRKFSPEASDALMLFLRDFVIWTMWIGDSETADGAPIVTVLFPGETEQNLKGKAERILGEYFQKVEEAWRWVADKMSPTKRAAEGLDRLRTQINQVSEDAIAKLERLAEIPQDQISTMVERIAGAQSQVIKSAEGLAEELGTSAAKVGFGFIVPAGLIAGGLWYLFGREKSRTA